MLKFIIQSFIINFFFFVGGGGGKAKEEIKKVNFNFFHTGLFNF